jgi:HSP20 family protein
MGIFSLRDEMDRLMNDFFHGMPRPFRSAAGAEGMSDFIPNIDVSETDGHVKVSAELPGMTEEDVNLEIEEEMLTISGEKQHKEEAEKSDRYWRESAYGRFRRDIPLPNPVQTDKAEASFKNGVLEMTAPKSETATPKRRSVEIRSE